MTNIDNNQELIKAVNKKSLTRFYGQAFILEYKLRLGNLFLACGHFFSVPA